jgi:threonine synthase
MWRYKEVLPVRSWEKVVTLGEGGTPLMHCERLGRRIGCVNTYIKNEALNPTGSFKARGLCLAVSKAYELGVTSIAVPSAGNAAGAMSAYAAACGMKAHVFMPSDVPLPFRVECKVQGAEVTLVDGLITHCGAKVEEGVKAGRWFAASTLKEPYRVEGKKTMAYEIAEEMGWTLPDVFIYPTGGGTGLIGMWKAFDEMEQMGLIGSQRPRMVAVQSSGCAPIVRAFNENKTFATLWENAKTVADGLRVPSALGDFLILQAIKESNGTAIAVPDQDMLEACNLIGEMTGVFAAPEGGACLAAQMKLLAEGWIKPHESVVLFNTGTGLKYAHCWNQDA